MNHEAWSAAQTSATLPVDGRDLEVAYYEAGSEHDGPPVVFLHGIPTWSFLWRSVAPPLSEHRHVVAPDLLGYGNSAMSDGFDRSIRAQEAMLDSLLAALGADRVDLVGHDIGGGVALRFGAHQPDRVGRLVLSNAVCYDSWPVGFINGLGTPDSVAELRDDDHLEETLSVVFDEGLYDDEGHEAFCAGMRAPWRSETARRSLVRNAVATNTNHTTEIDPGDVTAETLLLWGAGDVLQELEYAERLAADLAGETELVALEDAYHWVLEDRPEAYRRRLRAFLTGTD